MNGFDFSALAVIGLLAGLVGGMLGVGGSIVMIPAMTEVLGPDQHLYQAAAMIVNFFVVTPAVLQHRRAGAINAPTVFRLIPPAIVGVIAGVGLSELPLFKGDGEPYLRGLFGLFLLSLAVTDLYRLTRKPNSSTRMMTEDQPTTASPANLHWRTASMIAVPTGLIAGLLGVGGGLAAVPLQRKLLGFSIRTAIANSAAIIIATSLAGAMMKNYALVTSHGRGWQSFILAGVLIPAAVIGSMNGSKLTHRIPVRTVKAAFFVLLLIAALRITYQAGRSILSPETTAVSTHSEA